MNEGIEGNASQSSPIQLRRYFPGPRLRPFVRNFWTIQSRGTLAACRHQRVIPDGCIDIILVRRSPTEDYKACVVGTMTRPIFEELGSHVDYIGVRFAPGGFRYFFEIPPNELTDQIIPFESLSALSIPAVQMADSNNVLPRLNILENDLDRRLRSERQDVVLTKILEAISACQGNVTIPQLAHMANRSPRHLRRTFGQSVGISPKTFSRIIRFRSALRALRHSPQPDLLKIALDTGYYDQAHFIHDFNSFYGSSPSAVLKDPDF